jgi:hypothetical protein
MKCSPRFLATLVCSVVLSVPACGTLEKAGANQTSQLTDVHQGRLVATDSQVLTIPIEQNSWGGEGNHPVAEPQIAVKKHLPYGGCRPIPTFILCFMPCCF